MSLDMAIKCYGEARHSSTVCTGANGQRIALTAHRLENADTAAEVASKKRRTAKKGRMQLVWR